MQITIAPIHWIYLPEVLTDIQYGFVTMIRYLNGIEISLVTEYMVQNIKPEGIFILHAVISIFGFFFIVFFVKET